jgi:hypothetical protein
MATETLRPNAAGDETNLRYYDGSSHDPDPDHNFEQVDEETPDELATRVQTTTADTNWYRDLYNIADHSVGSGTIDKITVVARCRASGTPDQTGLKIAIKSGSTTDEGNEETMIVGGFSSFSAEWETNPDTSSAWTWSEIDSLQIGVDMRRSHTSETYWTACTQVYVEVDYTPAVTEKTSSDTGSGVEDTPLPSATLTSSETGSGIEAFIARLLAAFDTGYGVEAVVEVGGQLKNLFATELGEGSDTLTAKIEIPTKGGGMKLWT